MRALDRHVEREFSPSRKDTHWGRCKLARERCFTRLTLIFGGNSLRHLVVSVMRRLLGGGSSVHYRTDLARRLL